MGTSTIRLSQESAEHLGSKVGLHWMVKAFPDLFIQRRRIRWQKLEHWLESKNHSKCQVVKARPKQTGTNRYK